MAISPLASPGKVAVSDDGGRLAIADTGHDQVMVCLLDGLLLSVHMGLSAPRGVRFEGDDVVVCDTGAGRVVRTTGEVLADDLASPWDLIPDHGGWLVAETGRHRIVRIRPWEHQPRPAAGSGTRGFLDGPHHKAQLCDPGGLGRISGGVVVADSGSDALRLLDERGDVSTLAGPGAGLRRPLGVVGAGERVYVADALGSRLRVWDRGTIQDVPVRDGRQGLAEPAGLDLLPDGRLVVADTGNDRVVFVDPVTGGLEPLETDDSWVTSLEGRPLTARAGEPVAVPFMVHLAGEELDPSAGRPVRVEVEARPASLLAPGPARWELTEARGSVEVRAGEGLVGWGLLLVETTARTRRDDRRAVRVFRRRHRLAVS